MLPASASKTGGVKVCVEAFAEEASLLAEFSFAGIRASSTSSSTVTNPEASATIDDGKALAFELIVVSLLPPRSKTRTEG